MDDTFEGLPDSGRLGNYREIFENRGQNFGKWRKDEIDSLHEPVSEAEPEPELWSAL